jgi:hypothetical protein
MADPKHLEKLKSGHQEWMSWRNSNPRVIPNLTMINLDGFDLSMFDLSSVKFIKTSLKGANLQGANLAYTDFLKADLENANIEQAYFYYSKFIETNLNGLDFSKSQLGGVVFGHTDLSNCRGLENVFIEKPCIIDFPTLQASRITSKVFLTKMGITGELAEYLPDFYNSSIALYPAFLSHSWKDKPFVRKLYEAISRKGTTVYLDEKKMKPGDNIHDSISEAIKVYDKLILVCSENSINSWWVEKELERVYAKERELQKERGKKYRLVIPIRIDDAILDCDDGILATVKNSVIGDFTQWENENAFNKAVDELIAALNANRLDIKPPSLLD